MSALAILLLAAGRSTRMGQAKQLLPWADSTLLRHAAVQARLVTDAVFVVVGHQKEAMEAELEGLDINILYNTDYELGLGNSLAFGASAIADDGRNFTQLIVTLADQPSVDSAYLESLLRTGRDRPDRIVATAYGARAGVPALFPSRYFTELRALGGDAGAGYLLNAKPDRVVILALGPPPYDIDTPEDYRRHEGD